jgi:hypothetical protein
MALEQGENLKKKTMSFLCLIKYHVMIMYGETEVYRILTSESWKYAVSFEP